MADTNYFSAIVKILENPQQKILKNKFSFTIFRAELPQIRTNKIITIRFWGNLANEVKNYYQINDYILIEGYISRLNKKNKTLINKPSKKVTVTVKKVYPFLLKSDRPINKI
jgi:hypothetical protein